MTPDAKPVSTTTARAQTFVEAHREAADRLGSEAGQLVQDPGAVVGTLRAGLERLSDPEYLEGQQRIAPGIGLVLGVRQPLLTAVSRSLRAATARDSAITRLDVAERMLRDPALELHWLAFDLLHETIRTDPERTWQLIRGETRGTGDWITIDNLAHVLARGILTEPYRWAELEQLVYSPHRWERRLVGSTIATIPFEDRTAGRTPEVARRGLALLADLIGDAEPDVQKAISWALRNLLSVDPDAVTAFLRQEAAAAAANEDGHRAWVIRDTFEKLPDDLVAELRATLEGIRRKPGAPSTSRAAAAVAAFTALGVDVPPADRPTVTRS
jgi:3-methyladenine DNA glycosylase AlkD